MKNQALNTAAQMDTVKQQLLKVTKEYEDLRSKHEASKLKLNVASTKIKELAGVAAVDVEMRDQTVAAA